MWHIQKILRRYMTPNTNWRHFLPHHSLWKGRDWVAHHRFQTLVWNTIVRNECDKIQGGSESHMLGDKVSTCPRQAWLSALFKRVQSENQNLPYYQHCVFGITCNPCNPVSINGRCTLQSIIVCKRLRETSPAVRGKLRREIRVPISNN